MRDAKRAGPISAELGSAEFGDARLTSRVGRLGDALMLAPDLSLPKALDAAELEAAYRFFRNDAVTPERILEPHVVATAARVRAESEVIVVHDTTIMTFSGDGDRQLGPVLTVKQGFLAHFTLAVTSDKRRKPLGILGMHTIVRPKRKAKSAELPSESERWWKQIEASDKSVGARDKLIHVMDREADDFAVFAPMIAGNYRFVVRLAHDRVLVAEQIGAPRKLFDAIDAAPVIAEREVPISRRAKSTAPANAKVHPARDGRIAKLSISATSVVLRRPNLRHHRTNGLAKSVAVNVVHVREVEVPEGATPVTWILVTSDAVDTPERILAVVDRYRARWTIEEYFKVLKTGCAYEQRQLESAHSLFNALALFTPIAWQVMLLRSTARDAPNAPARDVFEAVTLRVLMHFSRIPLPPEPSQRQAMLAIAALGGHLKHNGEPGWQTLWAGHTKLVTLAEAWRAAASRPERSDQ